MTIDKDFKKYYFLFDIAMHEVPEQCGIFVPHSH